MLVSLLGHVQSALSSISRVGRALRAGFGRGFIEQAFRRLVVRSGLIHGVENAPFLQRRDAQLIGAGRLSAGHSRSEGPLHTH